MDGWMDGWMDGARMEISTYSNMYTTYIYTKINGIQAI